MYLGGAPRGKQGGGLQLLPPALPQHPGSVSQSQTPARRQSQLWAGLGRGRRQTEMYGQLPPQATPKLSISRKLSPHPGPQSDVRHPLPPKKGTDIHLPIPGRLGSQDLGERWWWGGITDSRDKSDSWTSAESQLYHQFQPQPQGMAFKSVTDPDGDPICCPPQALGGEGRPQRNLPEVSVRQAYLDWGAAGRLPHKDGDPNAMTPGPAICRKQQPEGGAALPRRHSAHLQPPRCWPSTHWHGPAGSTWRRRSAGWSRRRQCRSWRGAAPCSPRWP